MRKTSGCYCPLIKYGGTCEGSRCACWVQTLSHEHAKEWDDVPQGRCGLANKDSQEMIDDAEAED